MTDSGLKAIFLTQRPMLLRMLTARLGTREDAEDALQDMWLKLDQIGAQPVAQPAAFLYRVAANLATDRRIAASRRAARDTGWLEHQPEADEIPDAERVLVSRGQWQEIEHAIADMPDRMAAALRLFRLEQQPQRAIAEQLGISVSGVEKLLQRAYRKIHDRLAENDEDSAIGHRLSGEGETGRES